MKIISALLITSIFLFVSCNSSKNRDEESTEEKARNEEKIRERKELDRIETLSTIALKYNASAAFDTVRYKMTAQYQNFIRNNNKVIVDHFRIVDIEILDTTFLVSIEKDYSERKIYFDFTCSKTQIELLIPGILKGERAKVNTIGKYLILKLNSFKKIKLQLDSDYEQEDNGEFEPKTHTYIELNVSDSFICSGELVDIVIEEGIINEAENPL